MWAAQAGHSRQKPKYYTQPHGQFADFKDFDTDRMIEDFSAAFPGIPKDEVRKVVMYGLTPFPFLLPPFPLEIHFSLGGTQGGLKLSQVFGQFSGPKHTLAGFFGVFERKDFGV